MKAGFSGICGVLRTCTTKMLSTKCVFITFFNHLIIEVMLP
jgi:hypothetical protein